MRPKPDKLQHRVARFTVNQHQVRFDMTIPMILPVTSQRVIAVFLGQWLVFSQRRDNVDETLRQRNPMWAFSVVLHSVWNLCA